VFDVRSYKEPGSSLVVNDGLIIARGPKNDNNGTLGIMSIEDFSSHIDNASYEVEFMVDDIANWQDNPLEFDTPLGGWFYNNYGKGIIAYQNKAGQLVNPAYVWDGVPALSQLIPDRLYRFKIEARNGILRFLFDQSDGQGYIVALETSDYSAPFTAWSMPNSQPGRILLTSSDRGASYYFNLKVTTSFYIYPLYDQTRAVKSGATIPIRLQIRDVNGVNLSSPSKVVTAVGLTLVSTETSSVFEDAGNANPDNNFRYDATLGDTGGYIFNLKTNGLNSGTYSLGFTVGNDSTVYGVLFQVK
jgi:hypothetical protein